MELKRGSEAMTTRQGTRQIYSVSSAQIAARRRKLRKQRRWQVMRTSWQVLMVGGLTVGLVWVISLPDWMLRSAAQVKIEGNQSLAADTIRTLLPLQYPQFLLTLKPQAIVHQLESQAPIAEATVSRRLFPPGLTIRIQERNPVAMVYGTATDSAINPAAGSATNAVTDSATNPLNSELKPTAFLDERGTVIPYEKYMALRGSRPLPTLKVIGIQQDQQRLDWASLYQQVSQSPVKILEIDWQESGNLVLRTEMGTVHLGAYGAQFAKQLQTLDRMRYLTQKIEVSDIAFIDLRNPDMPRIETTQVVSPILSAAENVPENAAENAEDDQFQQTIEPLTESIDAVSGDAASGEAMPSENQSDIGTTEPAGETNL